MRLYNRINSLSSGSTASKNNKGLLVCNRDTSATVRPFLVNIINTDGSVTGITLGVYGAELNAPNQVYPNYSMIPFTVSSWVDLSGVTLSGFELF